MGPGEDNRLRRSDQEIAMSRRHAAGPGAPLARVPFPRVPAPGVPAPDGPPRTGLDRTGLDRPGLDRTGLDRLTDSQLAELLRDPERRDAACETLVSRYQSIVNSCARRYRLSAQYTEDLIQVGYVGLLKAINGFDPAVTPELAGYAHASVSGEIKRYFRDKRWQLRVRRADQELMLRARAVREELVQELGRAPADAEVARHLEITVEELEAADAAAGAFAPTSLDAELGGNEGLTLGDVLGQEDEGLERAVDLQALSAHWAELPRREQRILTLRFYGNKSQAEVAQDVGCSQMHVSRLEAHALGHLRQRLLSDDPG
jgi:RNA polymerase sigma-B factor